MVLLIMKLTLMVLCFLNGISNISTMNKDFDDALMLIMGWIAFAMLIAAVNLVVVIGKLIFGA